MKHIYSTIIREEFRRYVWRTRALANLNDFHVIEFGARCLMQPDKTIEFQAQPQLSFNKNFDMLITKLNENSVNNIDNFIFTVDLKQAERLHTILDDIQSKMKHQGIHNIIP